MATRMLPLVPATAATGHLYMGTVGVRMGKVTLSVGTLGVPKRKVTVSMGTVGFRWKSFGSRGDTWRYTS